MNNTKWLGFCFVAKRNLAVKHICEARHLAFLKLDMELNLVILFTKKLIVIHSSYEELDDTKWDV